MLPTHVEHLPWIALRSLILILLHKRVNATNSCRVKSHISFYLQGCHNSCKSLVRFVYHTMHVLHQVQCCQSLQHFLISIEYNICYTYLKIIFTKLHYQKWCQYDTTSLALRCSYPLKFRLLLQLSLFLVLLFLSQNMQDL